MSDVTMTVNPDVIKSIIEAKIKSALLDGLGANREKVFDEIITKLLSVKVDRDGKMSNYSSDIPWLEWLVKDLVMKVTREAMQEPVLGQKPLIVKAIRAVLKKRTMSIAENFVDHLEANTKESWKTQISVTFKKPTP